ncbi:MAG: glycosyltransferase [Solirubrobacteraceae bacterium]
MRALEHVQVGPIDPHRFSSVLSTEQYAAFRELIDHSARELDGRVIWNVNSTAKGGGVVELLRPLLGYARGAGVDARWCVIEGDPDFFAVTKRIHNHLHGFAGDDGPLRAPEHATYEQTLAAAGGALRTLVRGDDVVILHDPQTAGLVKPMRRTGATVIWRCHVGQDHANGRAHEAWRFLRGYVEGADAFVFSRDAYTWDGLPAERVAVIQPSIDAFSPKNQEQAPGQTAAILARAGILPDAAGPATFTRLDGTPGRVDHRATMVQVRPPAPEDRCVTQVSRWDRLKDPVGVMQAFAGHISSHTDAHLLLAGPETEAVSDDPEGAETYAAVRAAWHGLPGDVRARVHLASLPMEDAEENAAIVNAVQRHSDVVVQKSLAEGFGLTVAEAMWKSRPVVASRLGGIQDQIEDGVSGLLIANPDDLAEFGARVVELLTDPRRARQIGDAARRRVRDHFLGPYELERYFDLLQALIGREEPGPTAIPGRIAP